VRVLLVSVGSLGDTLPFIAWAREIESRGHEAIIGGNGFYEKVYRREGVRFEALYSAEEHQAALGQSEVWNDSTPVKLGKSWFSTLLPRAFDFVERNHLPGQTVVAAQHVFAGARVAQEVLGIPTASLHLQPLFLRSIYDSTGPTGSWPLWLRRGLDWLVDKGVDAWLGKPLNEYRRTFGLPAVKRFTKVWWNSPDLVINFFPEWFNPPQPDWPAQTISVGFPFFRNQQVEYEREKLDAFLEAGDPPILFSVSSFTQDAKGYFEASLSAVARMKKRAVFLTPYGDQIPKPLPESVAYFSFVPLEVVLARACLHVHHCGSGTLALTFDAGLPHVAVPQGLDQVDIAARLARLGVSRTIPPKKYSAESLASACTELWGSADVRERCRRLQEESRQQNALADATDALEALLAGKSSTQKEVFARR
jgi:UDP:flavonoid glycosyltransferase YjiC (YdhE family)